MGRKIKTLALALLSFGVSVPVFGYPFCITVPNQAGYTFGADVLFLKPSTPNLAYDVVTTPNSSIAPTGDRITSVSTLNPSYHWAFDVMAAYRFPCTGNDISVLWTHYGENSNHDSVVVPFTNDQGSFIDDVNFSTSFKYDAVDLDLGKRLNFGNYFNFRMFAGVRGAALDISAHKKIAQTTVPPTPVTSFFTLDQDSEFRGIGPQIGIEGRYRLGCGFGVDFGTTFSALVGRVDVDGTVSTFDEPPTTSTINTLNVERKNRFVPALDANLGLDYTFNLNLYTCPCSTFVIQGGYKIIHYWDVNELPIDNSSTNVNLDGEQIGFNNGVSFHGPYLGIKVNI